MDTCLVKKRPEGIQEDLDTLLEQMDYRDNYAEFMQTETGNLIHAVRNGETAYPPIYAECLQALCEENMLQIQTAGEADSAGVFSYRWGMVDEVGSIKENTKWHYPGADTDLLVQDIVKAVDPLAFADYGQQED